jgi:phage terminase Nu1 subunit (DNA packaging protein)
MATIAAAARHVDLSERRFKELLDEGVFERRETAGYVLDEVRELYIRHLRKAAAGRGDGDAAVSASRIALMDEQREGHAIKNSLARRELVHVDDVGHEVEREYAVVRERLLTIPGKLAASLVDADRPTIEAKLLEEISEALDELHDPLKVAGAAAAEAEGHAEEDKAGEAACAPDARGPSRAAGKPGKRVSPAPTPVAGKKRPQAAAKARPGRVVGHLPKGRGKDLGKPRKVADKRPARGLRADARHKRK